MALPDFNSGVAHSFGLDIDGITIKSIMEVSGLKMEQDVIELKQNTADGKYGIFKLPGRPKGAEITATRGLTGAIPISQTTWPASMPSAGLVSRSHLT